MRRPWPGRRFPSPFPRTEDGPAGRPLSVSCSRHQVPASEPARYHNASAVERNVAITEGSGRKPTRILVVEDEPSNSGFVRRGLRFEGYDVSVVEDGSDALRVLRDNPPDLVVLDVMVPGVDGLEIARRLRAVEAAESLPSIPVLMLTARDAVRDRVAGLRAGADDYLIKPFDFDELLARIEALLRRAPAANAQAVTREILQYGDLTVDLTGRTVRRGERDIQLTTREFELLTLLLRHPEQVLTRATIMHRIWGDDFFGDTNVLEVFIASLRRALESGSERRLIQTVRGVGYVLREPVAP